MQRVNKLSGGLSEIIRLSNWERLRDNISRLIGLSLLLFDEKGQLLSGPANNNTLCRLIEGTEEGRQACKVNCGKNINLSLSANKIIFFKCPANLHVFSLPLKIDGIKMVILGGKVLFSYQELSGLREFCQRLNIDPESLIPSKNDIIFHDIQFLRSSAGFIGTLAYYLFDGIYHKERYHDKFIQLMSIFNVISDLRHVKEDNQVYKNLLNAIGIIFNIESASIMIRDNDEMLFNTKEVFGNMAHLIFSYSSDAVNGIFKRVLDERRPILCNITFEILNAGLPKEIGSIYLIPLLRTKEMDNPLGILCIYNTELKEEEINTISLFCNQVAIILENRILKKMSKRYLEEELKKISITDSLTGLLNRRYFQERLQEEIERSKRHDLPLSLMIIDIDNFKPFNDKYGRPAGDEALKLTASCMRNNIRTIDVAARYGGEEFMVMLSQTTKHKARYIAERICREVERIDFAFAYSYDRQGITVSIGLASFPDDADNPEDLIRNSGQALYLAKEQGRNRVVLFSEEGL